MQAPGHYQLKMLTTVCRKNLFCRHEFIECWTAINEFRNTGRRFNYIPDKYSEQMKRPTETQNRLNNSFNSSQYMDPYVVPLSQSGFPIVTAEKFCCLQKVIQTDRPIEIHSKTKQKLFKGINKAKSFFN